MHFEVYFQLNTGSCPGLSSPGDHVRMNHSSVIESKAAKGRAAPQGHPADTSVHYPVPRSQARDGSDLDMT